MSKVGDDLTASQRMLSSCTGALVTSVTMTPLDVVKVRLQAQRRPFAPGSCFLYSNGLADFLCFCNRCNGSKPGTTATSNAALKDVVAASLRQHHSATKPAWYERPGHFNGTIDAFVKITRNEGITALWSGLPPTLLMALPMTVLYFTAYDQLKYTMGYKETDPSTKYVPAMAGMCARMIASSVFSPLDLLRVKMQSQQLEYRQLGEAVRNSVRANGILYMWMGLGPSLLRDVPFSGMYWFGYEFIKSWMFQHNPEMLRLSFAQSFLAGATAGTMAAVITLPFDVIKTHRQVQLGQAEVSSSYERLTSTRKLIVQLYRQQGARALLAGLSPRVMKVAPSCAIMIATYEFSKQYFQNLSVTS